MGAGKLRSDGFDAGHCVSVGWQALPQAARQAAALVESAFAQGLVDRAARGRQRNNWKSRGTWWNLNPTRMVADAEAPADVRRIRITGVTRGGAEGQLLYALDTDTVGGLFEYAPREDQERRVFHRNRFRARDLCRHPADGTLAFSVGHDDGSANIAVMESEGRGPREVTEGDSVDEAPSWSDAAATSGTSRRLSFSPPASAATRRGTGSRSGRTPSNGSISTPAT